jgi:hypothetical protein
LPTSAVPWMTAYLTFVLNIRLSERGDMNIVDRTWPKDIKRSVKIVLVHIGQYVQRLVSNLSVDTHDHD